MLLFGCDGAPVAEDAALVDAALVDAAPNDASRPDASEPEDGGSGECTDATWEACVYEPVMHPVDAIEGYTVELARFRRRFPILVRYPTDVVEPLPIVIASHGGSYDPNGHRDLAGWGQTLSRAGYAVIHMAHIEPDMQGDRVLCQELGVPMADCDTDLRSTVATKAIDAVALMNDLEAVGAWLESMTGARLDPTRIVTVGWSGGSQTGLTLGGAVRELTFSGSVRFSRPDERVLGAIALSPQGPGFSGYFETADETSMDAVTIPVLIGTGLHDDKPMDDPDLQPAIRRRTFENLPGGDGTQRLLFSNLPVGVGGHPSYNLEDRGSEDERLARLTDALMSAARAFADATLRDDPAAIAWLDSDAARILAGDADWVSR